MEPQNLPTMCSWHIRDIHRLNPDTKFASKNGRELLLRGDNIYAFVWKTPQYHVFYHDLGNEDYQVGIYHKDKYWIESRYNSKSKKGYISVLEARNAAYGYDVSFNGVFPTIDDMAGNSMYPFFTQVRDFMVTKDNLLDFDRELTLPVPAEIPQPVPKMTNVHICAIRTLDEDFIDIRIKPGTLHDVEYVRYKFKGITYTLDGDTCSMVLPDNTTITRVGDGEVSVSRVMPQGIMQLLPDYLFRGGILARGYSLIKLAILAADLLPVAKIIIEQGRYYHSDFILNHRDTLYRLLQNVGISVSMKYANTHERFIIRKGSVTSSIRRGGIEYIWTHKFDTNTGTLKKNNAIILEYKDGIVPDTDPWYKEMYAFVSNKDALHNDIDYCLDEFPRWPNTFFPA